MISERVLAHRFKYLEEAPFPIIVTRDAEFLIEFMNKAALELIKPDADTTPGQKLEKLFPELFTRELVREIYEKCFLGRESHIVKEKQLVYVANGKFRVSWYGITTNPIIDEGHVTGTISFLNDVTDRMVMSRSAVQPEPYFWNVFKQAPVGIVCYRGAEFIVEMANDRALEMWGKSIEEVKGKRVNEIFPEVDTDPEISKRHRESIARLARGETHVVNEVQLVFPRNGRAYKGWYSYIHEPYCDQSGNIVGMMAIAIEVTEQVEARIKLQLLTDALPSLVSYINQNEEYEFVNKAYEDWFGHHRDEMTGKTIEQVLGPQAYQQLLPKIRKALSGERTSFESWVQYKDGGQRYVSASYIPHLSESNVVLGYFALIHDLTERKIHEEALKKGEERLRLATEATSAGTFEFDLKEQKLLWSDRMKELCGFSRFEEITPQKAAAIIHPDDLKTVIEASDKSRNENSTGELHLTHRIVRNNDKAVRWLHTRSKVSFDEADGQRKAVKVSGFVIDITQQREAEEKLREWSGSLEREVQQRTDELKTINQLLTRKNEELHNTKLFLQQIIDSSVEYIAVFDRDLNFIAINSSFEKFTGKSRNELIGKHVLEVYPMAKGTQQLEILQRALSGEHMHLKSAASISRPDIWLDSHYLPLKIGKTVEGVIAMSRDVTAIIQSEQRLAQTNKLLADAQRLAKLGSWEWDYQTNKVTWSEEMFRIYDYPETTALDIKKATERMPAEYAEISRRRMEDHIEKATRNFRATGEKVYVTSAAEFPIVFPDGSRKLLRSSGTLYLTDQGQPYKLSGAIQDVTEIRAAEEKLHIAIRELEDKNSDLESFNYVASHDLKEPLRKILTFVDRMQTEPISEAESREYLQRVGFSATRMMSLIESMLALSRVSKENDNFTNVNLNETLENCKSDLEISIKEKNAKIKSDELPTLKASAFQMSQLFSNLLANSLKFCATEPEIQIECRKLRGSDVAVSGANKNLDYWCVSFSDNGIGFDLQFKDQIFEPFRRLHMRNEFSGTGIGLSIVKRIIQRHQGFLDVQSEKGKGSTFYIWLPALQVDTKN